MKILSVKNAIFAVLLVAFVLRIWNVSSQDILGDEAADAFRAVGYIDYLGTNFQTQPIDWYKDQPLPFWTKFSFHDLPPMAIFIQHVFFLAFGNSILVARLPAVILGVISVYLIYLVCRKLFNSQLALFAAIFSAIGGASVWIFRTSILEPFLIFFILLNIFVFLKYLENRKWWWLFGITLGCVALTKYTGIFILPVYFIYLLVLRRDIFKDWRFYTSFLIALILFSPVIVYNYFLFKTTGHFDLQFAYLLGQKTPEWQGLVGKIDNSFLEIGKNIVYAYGYNALAVLGFGLTISFFWFRKYFNGFLLFWLYLAFATLLFVKIGSAPRFLSLYAPAFAIFSAIILEFLWSFRKDKLKYVLRLLVAAILILEIIFTIRFNFINYPDYGVAKLDNYFEKEFSNKESGVVPEADNPHLNDVIKEFAAKKSDKTKDLFLVVYNDNIALPTLEWVFYRRFFYESVPVLYIENFRRTLNVQGADYFKGFTVYFVESTENTLLNPFKADKTTGAEMEQILQKGGHSPEKTIYGQNNLPMFRIYKFKL